MTTDESTDAPVTPKRRSRAWVWVAAAAVLVLAPAGWLGAEYALDLEEMDGIRSQIESVGELITRTSGEPADSGEATACDRAGDRLSALSSPPWWRHAAFTLLEEQQLQSASRRLAELRQVAAERRANRAWWNEQSSAIDAALAAPDRTIPDLFALRDSIESAQPPHPSSGGLAPDARAGAVTRIDAEAATLTETQDRVLREFAAVAERVAQATDVAGLDAALATAPDEGARDLNPPELDTVRERLAARAKSIRAEFAFRAALEASVASALSQALSLDPESASAGDAYAVVSSIEGIAVPDGARYASLTEAKAQAIDTARRRLALLEARDRDRAWLDGIAGAVPGATTARDAQALLRRLQEDPPGGCQLDSISRRTREIADGLRAKLQARRDDSRAWREDLAAAVDAMVVSRSLDAFAASADRVDGLLARGSGDPSSSEDAQADRAARNARAATAARLVRAALVPVAEAAARTEDPRRLPADVEAALSPGSPLASIDEAREELGAIRRRLDAKRAEHEAFDAAIDRARAALESGDPCAAAQALADALPRTAEQEWTRMDLRGAIAERALEHVESMVIGEGSLGAATLDRLERIVGCEALKPVAQDAVEMAARVWADVRIEADRTLWEDCRRTAREALERRDGSTYLGALSRYIASRGTMEANAIAARDAFAVPAARMIATEFVWGASSCLPVDAISDITITIDGDSWSGPIPAGEPGKVARLSREWTARSGSDVVVASASGVSPCEDPQPFAGMAEISLHDRRFGATLEIPCPAVGAMAGERAHSLRLKVTPAPGWLNALRLPPWRSPPDAPADASRSDAPDELPPRPESDQPSVTAPSQDSVPR